MPLGLDREKYLNPPRLQGVVPEHFEEKQNMIVNRYAIQCGYSMMPFISHFISEVRLH